MQIITRRTLFLVAAILAALFAALPAKAERYSIAKLSAPAAARVLRAQGVRVLAIGLELAPDPPRVADAKPAAYPTTSKVEPPAEHHGCNPWRRDVVVIPPPGVTVTHGPTVYLSSNASPRRRR